MGIAASEKHRQDLKQDAGCQALQVQPRGWAQPDQWASQDQPAAHQRKGFKTLQPSLHAQVDVAFGWGAYSLEQSLGVGQLAEPPMTTPGPSTVMSPRGASEACLAGVGVGGYRLSNSMTCLSLPVLLGESVLAAFLLS